MIELKNISKIYQRGTMETVAVKDFSLVIEKGDFVIFEGVSGTGKSTLLNIIGCVDKPSQGEYYFDGRKVDFSNQKQIDKLRKEQFGYVFQNYALMDKYNVYENVEMPLLVRRITKSERKRRIQESLKLINLDEPIRKYPNELSGGQQQRVAVARVFAMEVPIILADEPTGALDEKNAEDIIDLFIRLSNLGRTIVLVTHSGAMIERIRGGMDDINRLKHVTLTKM